MKRVLIISYYWLPSGGSGVQRWVKFCKYLPQMGWKPIVYTPENPEFSVIDHTIGSDLPPTIEVVKRKIWEPYQLYKRFAGKKEEKVSTAGFVSENSILSWKGKLSIWLRGNLFIPDPRCFWVRPSVKFLKKYIAKNNIDAIISTGPPHSMHLIAARLKKHFPSIKWVADFRDPWTDIYFYKELNLTKIADSLHHRLEKKVVQNADVVVTISQNCVNGFLLIKQKNIELITNGFDEDDFLQGEVELDKKFSIAHIGLLDKARNSLMFWQVLSEICKENTDFKNDLEIKLIGKVDYSVLSEIKKLNLTDNLKKIDYLPHNEAILEQKRSAVLLLSINNTSSAKGILTGKIFEYLAARRPIFAIGPTDGDAAEIIRATNAGKIVDFNDFESTKKTIIDFYQKYKNGVLTTENAAIDKYNRKNLTKQLVEILNKL